MMTWTAFNINAPKKQTTTTTNEYVIYVIFRLFYINYIYFSLFYIYIYYSCFIRSDVTPVRFCAFIRRQQTRKGVWKNVITFRAGSFLYIV